MNNHQHNLMLANVREFMKCAVIIGFDLDGNVSTHSVCDNELDEHALRTLLYDVANTECADMLLPSTAHNDNEGEEF